MLKGQKVPFKQTSGDFDVGIMLCKYEAICTAGRHGVSMTELMTEPMQQNTLTNSKISNIGKGAFSVVTNSGRVISGLKQFRDANPDLCMEIPDQKAYALHPSVIHITPGFNSREMGMGEDYYKLPEVAEHISNIKAAYIRGDYVDPIRIRIIDGIPFVRQGHCRLYGGREAIAEGHDVSILCVELKADELGCELATIDGNRGLALSPVALGESYRRLHNSLGGWSIERIAQRENKSPATISSMIRLTNIPVTLKTLIHANAISYVAVLELIDQLGESQAVEQINAKIAELEEAASKGIQIKRSASGQVRVTPALFKPAKVPAVLAVKAVEGVKVLNERLSQKLAELDIPEVNASNESEEINITLDLGTFDLLKKLAAEITEVENKQLRRVENRQAKLSGVKPEKKKAGRKPGKKNVANEQPAQEEQTDPESDSLN
ncbi:DNA-binding protein [Buttiauxella gaviniae]|uniref:DNA-binding protein n=1 Tax=Buttiauxella gaviniae TaxID=82990 RepID=UPI003C74BE62